MDKSVLLNNLVKYKYFICNQEGEIYTKHGNQVGFKQNRGYVHVDYKGKRFLAHRVIYTAFFGPIPKGFEINHINGKKDDNRLINLEMVTACGNIKHAFRTGLNNADHFRGSKNVNAKLTEDKVKSLRKEFRKGDTNFNQLARREKISRQSMRDAILGITYKHVTG